MVYAIKNYSVQKLITGNTLFVAAHYFTTNKGPRIFLQANLHGPEIFGSALLIKLIQYLKSHPEILIGNITIVPQANPIAVQQQIYGYQTGRWNFQNGKNWNRIFGKKRSIGNSIEERLSETLLTIAFGHEIVLDIHTSGSACVPHLFLNTKDVDLFSSLGTTVNFLVDPKDYCGAFDESCRERALNKNKIVHSATWEAGNHGAIDPKDLEEKFISLLSFLSQARFIKNNLQKTNQTNKNKKLYTKLKNLSILHAPEDGYLVWNKKPGDKILAGEIYGYLYKPRSGAIVELRAEKTFLFLIKHPLQAVSFGQEIAEVIFLVR